MKLLKLNSRGIVQHLALIIVVISVTVGGTAYLVASHADPLTPSTATAPPTGATTAPNYVSGYMDWRYEATSLYSPSFNVTGNTVCVATNFNNYDSSGNSFGAGYHWYLYKLIKGSWVYQFESSKAQHNGNRDHWCYGNIANNATYRVRFDLTGRAFVHGDYWVWGYSHN